MGAAFTLQSLEISTQDLSLSQFSNSVKSSIRGKMKSYKKNGWGHLAAFPWELLIFFILILPRMSRTTSSWALLPKHGKIMPVSRAVTSPRLGVLKALNSIPKMIAFLEIYFSFRDNSNPSLLFHEPRGFIKLDLLRCWYVPAYHKV